MLQAFGSEMEMQLYYGEDEGDVNKVDASSPGAIVIEAVSNIRTVAALSLEEERVSKYARALEEEDPHPLKTNIVKGTLFVGSHRFASSFFIDS